MKLNVKNVLLGAVGLGATVAGVVMMKKASIKATGILKEHQNNVVLIEECAATQPEEAYSEEDHDSDLKINTIQTAVKLVTNYTLPFITIVIGGYAFINACFKEYKRCKQVSNQDVVIEDCNYEVIEEGVI